MPSNPYVYRLDGTLAGVQFDLPDPWPHDRTIPNPNRRNPVQRLTTVLDRLRRERDELDKKIARLESKPEPGEPDATIYFKRKFPGTSNEYTYVGVKASNGLWYLTGAFQSHSDYTWASLLEFIGDNEIWVAAEWEKL